MGARFYAPSLGAFTQLDTYAGRAAHPASMNRYLYAEANPATLIDPDGHMVPVESAYCDPALHACGGTTKGGTGGTSSGTGGSGGSWGSGATQGSPVPVKPVAPVVVGPPPAVASPGDPWEVTATGGCIGISGGLGAYVALQFCGLRTSSGQQGVTVSLDTGGMAGGGASISAGPVWSNSTDLHQLSGGGGTFGGSIVDGAGGGVEVSVTRSDEKPVYTYSAFAAVGIKNGPLVAEIHAGGGPTGVLTVGDVVAWLHAQGWFN
jgi:hypothetical protein